MSKKTIFVSTGAIVALGVVLGLGQMSARQKAKDIPNSATELDSAATAILADKCVSCHSDLSEAPLTAMIPGIGSLIKGDMVKGCRHWDVADKSFLGADATEEKKSSTFMPLAGLNKLAEVLKDDTMPLKSYQLIHWGSNLSPSEKEILAKWIVSQRQLYLNQWGITDGSDVPIQPIPISIPKDPAKVVLGKALFNDTRLSKDNTIACASCHSLKQGGTDNKQYSEGVNGSKGGVNAPTNFNAVFHLRQFWDGRAGTLADQAGGPPLNPVEMASADWNEIIAKLEQDEGLKKMFLEVYPEGFTGENICDAIGEYEKTLITPNSRFDRYLKGDKSALSAEEIEGYNAFLDHKCATCHSGPAMGGLSFEYADLKGDYFAGRELTEGDAGLKAFSKNEKDNKRFKVPTLRNVALTSPYMHDGSKKTLKEAVVSMLTYQVGSSNPEESADEIVSFLKANTGELNGRPLESSEDETLQQ